MSKVIIAIWSDGRVEPYSTLTLFLRSNPEPKRSRDTIDYHLTKKVGAGKYVDEYVTLHRCTVTRAAGGLKTKTLKKVKTKKGQLPEKTCR
ncbi:MAG: hypothetical protein ACK53T_01200 [Planctomycetota bacterium]|jgi:hypothetical protein